MGYERLDEAIRFAAKHHDGQVRDGEFALPYIVHPIEVMVNLRHVGGVTDEDLLVVAALHDLVEETSVCVSDIRGKFGDRVGDLVKELTRYEPTEKEREGLTKDEIWLLRSSILLKEVAEMSADAQQVKLADRLSNLRESERTRSAKKSERYRWQTVKLLEAITREVNRGLWETINRELDPSLSGA